ncbi:cell wall-binding repeat-containing protein [Dactylosporangium aurantiacum]|uniref:Cell wall-binding repeat-containing protein n=1 Tax=Dactylosporangium aurantiacum TaxID=35754 RepID=A0A9Q9IHY3_9ACTN|nr:cell wall-binding repeat-containing protein [Dactylosporangium aurantiacum]MDG6100858.1 cell wall-binding repeat-containing protein [Dactylosporangium aurantiacum]UWZ55083.1 cell wall-binding repeat-containing protein [Dactylosporangium aurantiacum]
MSHTYARRIIVGGVTLATVAATATAANATQPGEVGQVAYRVGGALYRANPDGSGATLMSSSSATPGTTGSWSDDGSRYAYSSLGGLVSVRNTGGWTVQITGDAADIDPEWSPGGRYLYFSRNGHLFGAVSDGSAEAEPLGADHGNAYQDTDPAVSSQYQIIFERTAPGQPVSIWQYPQGNPSVEVKLVDGASPDFAPDGDRFAYIFAGNLWTAAADGSDKQQLTTDGTASDPAYSPDGTEIAFSTAGALKKIKIDGTGLSTIKAAGTAPAWQTLNTNGVERVWGSDGVATAIATSQWNYVDDGQGGDDAGRIEAGAVVLTRSDTYLDALVGSALAIKNDAPLLITKPGNTVEPRVVSEIGRVLGGHGDVYLLGGTLALPEGIETQLKNLGYTVHRIWGQNHYETAVAINQQITTDPQVAIVTTGANYYDALAAGAAAGAVGDTAIILTDGGTMPPSSAAYLNSLDPSKVAVVTAGGPGDTALANALSRGQLGNWAGFTMNDAYRLVGNDEISTALQLAKFFFSTPTFVAISTNRGWQDALTGGAMIGASHGPLLLTAPDRLDGGVTEYLAENSASIWYGVMLGGYLALPDALIEPYGNAFSAQFTYFPGGLAAGKTQLRAQPAQPRSLVPHADLDPKSVPGLRAGR